MLIVAEAEVGFGASAAPGLASKQVDEAGRKPHFPSKLQSKLHLSATLRGTTCSIYIRCWQSAPLSLFHQVDNWCSAPPGAPYTPTTTTTRRKNQDRRHAC